MNSLIEKAPRLKRVLSAMVRLLRFSLERLYSHSCIEVEPGNECNIITVPGYRNIFCGYYDVSPFRLGDPDYILLHATNLSAYSLPTTNAEIDLLLYQVSTKEWRLLDKTATWNWQQGARLQWLDAEYVAYNILYNGTVRCRVLNVETYAVETLPVPLSIAESKEKIISIDYYALTEGSEYGYPGISQNACNSLIQTYDLKNKRLEVVFDWKELRVLSRPGAIKEHINHILYSPDKERFVFIYRYWVGFKRYDSLIKYEFKSKSLHCIIENQVVSHYCWRDCNTLFAWIIVNDMPAYYLIDVQTKDIQEAWNQRDGHPSAISKDKFITDRQVGTKMGGKYIQAEIIDILQRKKTKIIRLSHPTILDSSHRCDMHISLSNDLKKYQLDSRHIHDQRTVIVGDLACKTSD